MQTVTSRQSPPAEADLRAEVALIGGLLRFPDKLDEVSLLVRPDHCTMARHAIIYRAMLDLRQNGKPVDMVSVFDLLADRGEIEQVGGHAYLARVFAAASANVEYYACLVRENGLTSQLCQVCADIVQQSNDGLHGADLLQVAEREVFALTQDVPSSICVTLDDALDETFTKIDNRVNGIAEAGVIKTGFHYLDDKTGGLHPTELTIIAARTSVGKTAFACNIVYHAILAGNAVFFASLEQPACEIAERLLLIATGANGTRLRIGAVTVEEREAILAAGPVLRNLPLHIADKPAQSMLHIATNARRLKARERIGLLVLDYIQLVEPEDRKAQRQEQVASVSRRLKVLARELEIPVVALAQVNRGPEDRADRKPRLSDLRESGALEQDADAVFMLSKKNEPEAPEGWSVVLDVAKQRHGPVCEVELFYRKRCLRFESVAQHPE